VANILIIDDDMAMEVFADNLRYRGHEVERISSSTEAIRDIKRIVQADLVLLDVIMAWPEQCKVTELSGAHVAGMEVYREIRKARIDLPVILYSGIMDKSVIEALSDDPNAEFISKWDGHSVRDLVNHIQVKLGTPLPRPQSFIVHGQNETVKYQLKNYLQNTLLFPEPIILHEQPNIGRTIIEKFEDYALKSSLVFVLLTPDDIGALADKPDDLKRRGRQNVIFEMGYFLGMLGRKSGRVILLHSGPLELPSDLLGVVYIDISKGIESAGELIRKELEHVI